MTAETQPDDGAKRGSLTARAAWLMSARTLGFVFSFGLPLLLVRRLDQDEFGLYKQVFLIVSTAMYILPIGFHMSAFYFLPREPERRGEVVLNILLFHLFVMGGACLALVLWPGLLAAIFRGGELAAHAPLIGVVVLLWGTATALEYLTIANEETRLSTAFIVSMQLTRTVLLIAAGGWFGSVRAIVWAAVAQGLIHAAVMITYAHRRFRIFRSGFDWQLMRRQLSYALPIGVSVLLARFMLDVDSYFVSHQFDAATFAVYAVGCFNLPLFSLLLDAVGSVMITRVSQLQKEGALEEIKVLTTRMARKLAAVAFPCYAFLLVTGPEFVTLLFTEQYLASWPVFAVNLAQIPLGIVFAATDPVVRAYAEHRYFLLKVRGALFALLVLLLWAGVARFGLVGAVSMVVAVTAIERVIMLGLLRRVLGWRRADWPLLADVGKLAVAAAAAAAVAVVARSLMHGSHPFVLLSVCGVIYSAAYAAAAFALGVVTPDERDQARRQFARLTGLAGWPRSGAAH